MICNGSTIRNIHYYGFKVPNNFGERYLVLVEIVYAHAFKPVPLYIDMVGPQYVKFYGNIYTPSPYETRKQKTKITYVVYSDKLST